ncbi:MAG: hypothetical protein KGZ92_08915 [Firmicutes bacterium]|nr:hypothetical protein [Dethiobacter sp.]MBS3889383.1 hypothetical protein [Bacillota bacterium]MBS4054814.1 hypothetical protein [Thermaerobacter sp.]
MNKDRGQEEDVEKFRYELAEELGYIEQADSGKKSRGLVSKYRPPRHLRQKTSPPKQ